MPDAPKKKRKRLAIVTSDCHLQERAWSSRTTLHGDAFNAFEEIVEYACSQGLPIIAAGDIIDKQKNEAAVAGFVRRMMEQCQECRLGFLYIQGQHELQEHPWLTELSNWPEWLPNRTKPKMLGGKRRIHGIDWTPVDKLEEALAAVPPETDILVMHQVASAFMGSVTSPELTWQMIPSHVKLLILGDYHVHKRVEWARPDGSKLIILSPGSTAMQSIDEPPVKEYFLLYDDFSTESLTIPSRPFLQPTDLVFEEDLDHFVEQVGSQVERARERVAAMPEELQKPILYVRYHYDIKDAYKRLTRAIGDSAHFFFKELRPKTKEDEREREEMERVVKGGLLGALDETGHDPDSLTYRLSHRLLSAKQPRKELIKIRKELLDAKG